MTSPYARITPFDIAEMPAGTRLLFIGGGLLEDTPRPPKIGSLFPLFRGANGIPFIRRQAGDPWCVEGDAASEFVVSPCDPIRCQIISDRLTPDKAAALPAGAIVTFIGGFNAAEPLMERLELLRLYEVHKHPSFLTHVLIPRDDGGTWRFPIEDEDARCFVRVATPWDGPKPQGTPKPEPEPPFWTVWCEDIDRDLGRYDSTYRAEQVAIKYAEREPGKPFYVMHAYRSVTASTEIIRREIIGADDVAF